MKKVLIYYRYFGLTIGGGEYLPLTIIAELQKKSCDVTLALDWTDHFERAVGLIGVPVDLARLKVVKVMPENYRRTTNNAFESYFRFRRLRRLAKDADVCISLANIMDFGRPAHHVLITADLGDPAFDEYQRTGQIRRAPLLKRLRRFAADSLLRPLLGMRSKRKIILDPRERIYPNSKYVMSLMEGFYGPFNGTVFLPPTLFECGTAEPSARDPLAVLFIGRVAPSKRVVELIEIVEKARALSGKDITVNIAGRLPPGPYKDRLDEMAATRKWIRFAGEAYGEAKATFLLSGTYAIHARDDEPFGISVTEYLKAGLIPLVANGGGAKEIVDNPELTFRDRDEGARILARLVADGDFRERMRLRCAERAGAFSKESYLRHQREILASIMNGPSAES